MPTGVVAVLTAVRRAYPQHRSRDRILQVDHFLGSPVGRVADVLCPAERLEKPEVEGE
jgi:hypothetical protein